MHTLHPGARYQEPCVDVGAQRSLKQLSQPDERPVLAELALNAPQAGVFGALGYAYEHKRLLVRDVPIEGIEGKDQVSFCSTV